MKHFSYLMSTAIVALTLTACSQDDDAASSANGTSVQPAMLALDGGDNYIDLTTSAEADWQIVECPEWITPVADSGSAADTIRIYVEGNRRNPLRTGDISVLYANGKTVTTRAEQDNKQSEVDMRRSHACGWGFDVRTFRDSRGLRDQIFNIQKILNANKSAYHSDKTNTSSRIEFYYGDDASNLQNNMKAGLKIDGNFKVFSLNLQADFGMSAINDSKRIFSWLRDKTPMELSYFNAIDFDDVQDYGWFTKDFAAMRDSVINSGGSESTIRQLIDNYGTHFVTMAQLGGLCDYYYSSVFDNSKENINVEAALTFSYQSKFKLNADATYANDLAKMNQETIERFSVKGGENVEITNSVYSGTINSTSMAKWKESLKDGKLELLSFTLTPINDLFPEDIADAIRSYTDRIYYSDIPVTRTVEEKKSKK